MGIEAIMILLTGNFLEPIEPVEIYMAYSHVEQVAENSKMGEWFRAELAKRVLRESSMMKPALRDTIMNRLKVKK